MLFLLAVGGFNHQTRGILADSYGGKNYVFVAVRCDFHERNSVFKWELTVFNRLLHCLV